MPDSWCGHVYAPGTRSIFKFLVTGISGLPVLDISGFQLTGFFWVVQNTTMENRVRVLCGISTNTQSIKGGGAFSHVDVIVVTGDENER